MDRSCNLCHSKNLKFIGNYSDRMYPIKGKYKLFECSNCNLKFLSPPSDKKLSDHYPPSDYYSFLNERLPNWKKKIYSLLYLKDNFFVNSFRKLSYPLLRKTKVFAGENFLDIGCGGGEFIDLMNSLGMISWGVEPGQKYNKEKIFYGTLKEAKYPSNFFKVITMRHVFEHVKNPSEEILEIKRILKRGGFLFVEVPLTNSLNYKIFKENWFHLDIPRHLFDYCENNIRDYFTKEGFIVEKVEYTSTAFSFFASLFYLRNKNKYFCKDYLANRFLLWFFLPFFYILNFFKVGDQACFTILKK